MGYRDVFHISGKDVIQEQFSKQEDTFSIALQFSKTLPGTVVTWDCRKVPLKKVAFTHFANKRSGTVLMFSSSKVEANSFAFTQSSNNPAGIDKILGIAEKVELNFTAEEHPLNVLAGIEFRAVYWNAKEKSVHLSKPSNNTL